MPFLDRSWWLRPVLAAVGLVVPGQPMKLGLVDDGFLDIYIRMSQEDTGVILYHCRAILFFLAIAFAVATNALPARRKHLRLSAIDGDADARPPALVTYEYPEYDLAQKPVVIKQQLTKEIRPNYHR